jgi:hypothetical protein
MRNSAKISVKNIVLLTTTLFFSFSIFAGSPERFEAHMNLLANDLLAGRDTGSIGHDFTALYLASELPKYGVKPAGNDNSYYQMIPFKQSVVEQDSPKLSASNGQETLEFTYMDNMLMSADMNQTDSQLEGELVFVGFGIDAPYLGYSDFGDIDVKGKIAVVLFGRPNNFPSEEGAHFISEARDAKALTERGAIGVITISTPVFEKLFPFERRKLYTRVARTKWIHPNGDINKASPQIKNSATLSIEAGKKLFALAGMDLDAIFDDIANNKQPRAQAMGISAKASVKSIHSETQSPNVIGVLEGSDPILKNEYVILTAHSDHIGISQNSVKKDKINNGAMDNASGVSTLLEIAYELHSTGVKPKRSIIFAFVTGEEKGLLGSDYYAHYPTLPIEQIVANVNLDMPILTYRTNEMIAFGSEHSSLKASVTQAMNQHNIRLIADPMPEQALFVRSDQYSLVKKGVPAVYLKPSAKDIKSNTTSAHDSFRQQHYHMPTDDLNLPIDYEWAAQFVDINLAIAINIANAEETPKWNNDSFFKSFTKTSFTKN